MTMRNCMKPAIISSENKTPTIAIPRERGAVVLLQGTSRVRLDRQELKRLIAVVGESHSAPTCSTTPAKAQMVRWSKASNTIEPAN
jgi:hypothetical protein